MTGPDVWRSWSLTDPEPAGVTIVRDSSGVVSYTDSPEWKAVGTRWQGWKAGERISVDWVELLLLYGPVTGKVRAVAASEVAA